MPPDSAGVELGYRLDQFSPYGAGEDAWRRESDPPAVRMGFVSDGQGDVAVKAGHDYPLHAVDPARWMR